MCGLLSVKACEAISMWTACCRRVPSRGCSSVTREGMPLPIPAFENLPIALLRCACIQPSLTGLLRCFNFVVLGYIQTKLSSTEMAQTVPVILLDKTNATLRVGKLGSPTRASEERCGQMRDIHDR